jgi:hypothetical protein
MPTIPIAEDKPQNPVQNSKLQSYLLAAAFILFVLALVLGIFSGVTYGKDKATLRNLETISIALKYYNSDQDRYPTAAQFNDQRILTPVYMKDMPTPQNATGICSANTEFQYSQKKPSEFTIQFCLRQGADGFSKGQHVLTEKGAQ